MIQHINSVSHFITGPSSRENNVSHFMSITQIK